MAQRSLAKRVTYNLTRALIQMAAVIFLQIRCEGRGQMPTAGGALVCSNHQSYLDPLLVGLACQRRMNFLARESLFRWRPFGRLLRWYDTIPIQRDGFGLSGMRETLRRLRKDELVLMFPEGTRTRDGQLGSLKPGICTLARRAGVPLVPVAIEGAYRAWPRNRRFPGRARVTIRFGPPITTQSMAVMSDEQLLGCLGDRIRACQRSAQQSATTPRL